MATKDAALRRVLLLALDAVNRAEIAGGETQDLRARLVAADRVVLEEVQ